VISWFQAFVLSNATCTDRYAAATAHLKQMTNKMAESKRLIKEYEKAAQGDPAADPAATAVGGLYKFIHDLGLT
jgi:hypothetical protein